MPRKSTKTKNIKLVDESVETTDTQAAQEVTTEEAVTESTTTTSTDPNRGEIIDVEWEQVQPIFEFKKRLEEAKEARRSLISKRRSSRRASTRKSEKN